MLSSLSTDPTDLNPEEIDLDADVGDEDEHSKMDVTQKSVPDAVFGALSQKRGQADPPTGALERFKKHKGPQNDV